MFAFDWSAKNLNILLCKVHKKSSSTIASDQPTLLLLLLLPLHYLWEFFLFFCNNFIKLIDSIYWYLMCFYQMRFFPSKYVYVDFFTFFFVFFFKKNVKYIRDVKYTLIHAHTHTNRSSDNLGKTDNLVLLDIYHLPVVLCMYVYVCVRVRVCGVDERR